MKNNSNTPEGKESIVGNTDDANAVILIGLTIMVLGALWSSISTRIELNSQISYVSGEISILSQRVDNQVNANARLENNQYYMMMYSEAGEELKEAYKIIEEAGYDSQWFLHSFEGGDIVLTSYGKFIRIDINNKIIVSNVTPIYK